eukprot:ANDGO_06570.mRNA.1 hypothetical protein PTSG_01113
MHANYFTTTSNLVHKEELIERKAGHMTALPVSQDVLSFYKESTEKFDKERESWICRIDALKGPHSYIYGLERKLAEANDKIAELESEASELKISSCSDREKILELQEKCNRFEIQALQDAKDLQCLLGRSAAQQNGGECGDITYFKDNRPETSIVIRGAKKQEVPTSEAPVRLMKFANDHPTVLKRNVVLDSADAQSLSLTIENLKAMLVEHQKLERHRNSTLEEDRARREHEFADQRKRDGGLISTLRTENDRLRGELLNLTREMCVYRRNTTGSNSVLVEELNKCRSENSALETAIKNLKNQISVERMAILTASQEESDSALKCMRKEIKQRTKDMSNFKAEANIRSEHSSEAIEKLKTAAAYWKARCKRTEVRLKLSLEGFGSSCNEMQKLCSKLEVNVVRYRGQSITSHDEGINHQVAQVLKKHLEAIVERLRALEQNLVEEQAFVSR